MTKKGESWFSHSLHLHFFSFHLFALCVYMGNLYLAIKDYLQTSSNRGGDMTTKRLLSPKCNFDQFSSRLAMAYTNRSFDLSLEVIDESLQNSSTRIALAWTNLQFEVCQLFGKRKPLLNQLNGYLETGKLTGILGVSGAGKSTLLNCLSGRQRGKVHPESKILIHTSKLCPSSVFIEQHVHESIHDCLSVREVLHYAFLFKNHSLNFHLKDDHIASTMKKLLLPVDILETNFGKCSGGQQRRIAVAQELMSLTPPDFLFLDEVTTGLDSMAAFEVVHCLKNLTETHKMTIVSSIHAPNQQILDLFDKIYVLAKGGVCIYAGIPSEIQPYLELQLGVTNANKAGYKFPPIEKLIKISCNDLDDKDVRVLAKKCFIAEYTTILTNSSQLKPLSYGLPDSRKRFSFYDLSLHVRRQFHLTFVAKYHIFLIQLLFYITNMAFLSSVFSGKDMVYPNGCYLLGFANESAAGSCHAEIAQNSLITENFNFLSFTITIIAFCILSTSTVLFAPEAKIFLNEYQNKCYSLIVFFLSTTFIAICELFILILFISLSAYFFSGQNLVDTDLQMTLIRLTYYFIALFLKTLYTQSIGQLVGVCLLNSHITAIVTSNLIYDVLDTFNDYYIKTEDLNIPALIWFSDLIGFKYISRLMVYTFYGIGRCNSEVGEVSFVLEKHLVEPEKITFYITRCLINIFVLKLLTFLVMYIKFNSFKTLRKMFTFESKAANAYFGLKPISDFMFSPTSLQLNDNNNSDFNLVTMSQMKKSESELSFSEFSKNKIIICFKNLTLYKSSSIYEINNSADSDSIILNGLNGHFRFGTLNAVLGSSGSGKTSLLRVLNGQCKNRLNSKSQVYLSRFTQISTCFVAQVVSDHLMPGLTAKQSLVFASKLKNQAIQVDHVKLADAILAEFNLTSIAETKVENCSGGEQKRLALALELTALESLPNLCLIDEPVSGLDSSSAEIVISVLRKLAHSRNLTIITSIHSPSSEVLYMFDHLYCLARGGVCIYSGPPNRIADHLQSTAAAVKYDTDGAAPFPIEQLISYSCEGPECEQVQRLMRAASSSEDRSATAAELTANTQVAPEGVLQNRTRFSLSSVAFLSHRYFIHIVGYQWKELLAFALILFYYGNNLHVFWPSSIATVSGCLNLEDDFTNHNSRCGGRAEENLLGREEKAVEDNVKYTVFMCILFLLFIVLQASLTLYREMKCFLCEKRNGWYSASSFYLTKCLLELLIIFPLLLLYVYICDIYSAVHGPVIYWHMLLIITLTVTAAQALSHMFILFSRQSYAICAIICLTVFELFLLLSNFFISLHRLHYFYQFLSNLNTARFALEASLLLQFGFGRCGAGQVQPVLYWMNLTDDHYSFCIQMLFLHIVFYRLAAFTLLKWKVGGRHCRRERSRKIEEYLKNVGTQPNGKPAVHFFGHSQLTLLRYKV